MYLAQTVGFKLDERWLCFEVILDKLSCNKSKLEYEYHPGRYLTILFVRSFDDKISPKQQPKGFVAQRKENKVDVILGIKITRTQNGLVLSQTHYVDKILEKCNQGDTSIAGTPTDTSQQNRGDNVTQVKYSKIIGSLMYLMSCTRPDLAYAVSRLSRYTSNPSVEH
ncbi:hypothetical protein OSB04_003168 [Centaurea solstitialis]|uniref:Reverse transcriptase Ty1/copia-type domain-containing protein n=1 Tax=Centaurea solstitialis TaxID=347529 RepID=A0AA38WNH4_9ASTR|nr:hypothetical protein OSB04_003168 [Centaurea solstitialis]